MMTINTILCLVICVLIMWLLYVTIQLSRTTVQLSKTIQLVNEFVNQYEKDIDKVAMFQQEQLKINKYFADTITNPANFLPIQYGEQGQA